MGEEEHKKEEPEEISEPEEASFEDSEDLIEETKDTEEDITGESGEVEEPEKDAEETEEDIPEEEKEEPVKEVKEEKKEHKKEEHHKEKSKHEQKKEAKHEPKERKPFFTAIKEFYNTKYKGLLVIPFAILIIALVLIGAQIATTGDFVKKDVSLKGGLTLTIPTEKIIDVKDLEAHLIAQLPNADLSVRALKKAGQQVGIIIDGADVEADEILVVLEPNFGKLGKDDYSVEFMGSSLGESFFREIIKAIYVSFLFMGIVVFWYFGKNTKLKILGTLLTLLVGFLMFSGTTTLIKEIIAYLLGIIIIGMYIKTSVPSFMVIFNVFSDLIVSLAVVNLLGIKLSTAGIAAFLMIIGYSVDTNILLSTKLLKRKEGSINERLSDAIKTGMTMTLTTFVAVLVALIFTQSDIIRQIMVILLIGLVVDTIYTWIQNVGILRIYLERHKE